MKKWFTLGKKFLAILCIFIGILGLFLPFLQGILLILIGLVGLGVIEKEDVKNLVKKYRNRFNK